MRMATPTWGGEPDTPPSKPFESDLQTQAGPVHQDRSSRRSNSKSQSPRPRASPRVRSNAPPSQRRTRSKETAPAARTRNSPSLQTRRGPAAPIWSAQGTAQLRASLGGTRFVPSRVPPGAQKQDDDDPALAVYYACAKEPANLREDGAQREMTLLEEAALFRWMDHQLHLDEPPLFLYETHTGAEEDELADFNTNHLGFRLYGILPSGTTLSHGNAKYHLCETALIANARDPVTCAAVESMFHAAQVITSEPRSKIAILRFVRPEERDAWEGLTFRLGSGTVTMTATDSLTIDIPRVGMDAAARTMLYHIFAHGHRTLKRGVIRAIFAAAAKMGVFDVKSIESRGLVDFSSPKWMLVFAQVTCPPALEHVRRLEATYNGDVYVFDIQHPRAAHRAPCAKCLSIRHVTTACKNSHAAQGLERHTLRINVDPQVVLPKLTAAISPKALKQQLKQLRQVAAPALAARLKAEKKERHDLVVRQAKQAADRAAKAAAEKSRKLRAVKEQAAADRAERQLLRSKAIRQEVADHLTEIQNRVLREQAAHEERPHSGTDGAVGQGKGTGAHDEVHPVDATVPASQAAKSSTDSEPEGVSDAPVQDESTQSEQSELSESSDSNASDAPNESRESSEVSESSEADTSSELNASNVLRELGGPGDSSDPEKPATSSSSSTTAEANAVSLATAPLQASPEATSAGAVLASSALVLYSPPLLIGKPPSPPSPTSSDDEEQRSTKWIHTAAPPSPFSLDISPIEVAKSLTEIIADAVANSADPTVATQAPSPPPFKDHSTTAEKDGTDAKPKRRQLALSDFYAPESLADAHERLEQEIAVRKSRPIEHWIVNFPSPALDALLDDLRSPRAIAAWLLALNARVICVPGNGGCLYYSLHCCRTGRKLVGKSITVKSAHSVEGNHCKAGVCENFLDYLEQMLSDGTITITELYQRFFETAGATTFSKTERQAALKAICAFIAGIAGANLGGKGLTRSQWGGDAEIFAAVWFIREPIFILTEAMDGTTSVRVVWLDRLYPDGPERIIQYMPEAGEAYEMIRSFLRHRAIPTVIIHITSGGDGHYNSLRFAENHYAEWTIDDTTGAAMRGRMDQVLAALGWYVAPRQATGIPKTTIASVADSGSQYEPSQPRLLDSPGFGLSPDAPLSPPAHFGLLSALNPRRRRRSALASLWAQAERLDLIAYRVWDEAQLAYEPRSEPDTVESGCEFWSSQISQLVALLRALPYPEVAMSLMKPELLVRLGNELNDLVANGTVPEFVRAEDPVEARRQWVRLVALVVVVNDDSLNELHSVEWLRLHRTETMAALHDLRLYDWTIVSTLAAASAPTLPTHSSTAASTSSNPVLAPTLPVQQGMEHAVRLASTPSHTSTQARRASASAGPERPRVCLSPATDQLRRAQQARPQLQLLTQNVQGLAKNWATVLKWFDGFRGRTHDGKFDMVILQETRATAYWAPQLAQHYARAWGFAPAELRDPLSFWPATPSPAGGVAILLHPDSAITDVVPWQQSEWSARFVAIQATAAPVGLVLFGGDFNCTMDSELDRSRRSAASQPSPGLGSLLEAWSVVDAVMDDMTGVTTRSELTEFRSRYHSYMYRLKDDAIATARLDRWYVSLAHYGQIGRVATATPVSRSDHDSVAIGVFSRDAVPRSSGRAAPQLRYPLPACAVTAITECSRTLLESRGPELAQLQPAQAATAWDLLKQDIRRACLTKRREQLTAATGRHKMRLRRLRQALKDARKAASPRLVDGFVTMADLTTRLSALALDSAARYRSIHRTLITAQESRACMTGHARQARYAGRPHGSSKAFYRRISLKLCRRATHSLPLIPGSTVGVADRVARDWRPITQRTPMATAAQDFLFAKLPGKTQASDLTALDDPFTAEEVVKAIKACPRGKACGPDGLGNDWYREHGDELAPLLAPLYTKWYAARVLPPSFAAASVFCVPKKSDPATGLDFRPIALLNTDYKIYARFLLHRVRLTIPRLVSETQYGFVPGRQVHDPIDIWTALQRKAASSALPHTAVAVLLDFAKAYDSLDRQFLSLALKRHGFSPALIEAVEAMHLGTTAAYIADGQTSATEEVTTGIRQGCPFAPTLFILAVDVLYELILADPRLPGLRLDVSTSVVIVGFADDTTTYLSSTAEAHALVGILDEFAAASGLVVNKSKSLAVRFRSSEGSPDMDVRGFPVATETQLVRYLGAQISTTPQPGRVWDVVLQQIRARLYLAEIKTTDLLQRVQVCQAVIIPKVLFVARHSWLSSANIQRLQRFVHNYAWHGSLMHDGVVRRAWMSAAVASARRDEGGLQLPNIRTELLLMSAATVRRWLSAQNPLAAAVGRVLSGARDDASSPLVVPARGPAPAPRISASMATSGRSLLRAAACHPREADERDAILPLLDHAGRAPVSEATWTQGWYCRDYSRYAQALQVIKRLQRERYGKLNVASLLATPVLGHGLLLHASGREIVASDFPGLDCSTARLGELVEIQWARQHLVHFRLRGSSYPYRMATSFRRLCDMLVMCYPGILAPLDPPESLTERSHSQDIWSLHKKTDGLHLLREVGPHERVDLGAVDSLHHAEAVARSATGRRRVRFAPHPLLSVVLPLWGSTALFPKTRLRSLATGASATSASIELDRRQDAIVAQSDDFAHALNGVSWKEVHSLPHSSSRQLLLYHKIKGKRLSG